MRYQLNTPVAKVVLTALAITAGWVIYGSSEWALWRKALIAAVAYAGKLLSIPVTFHGYNVTFAGIDSFIGRDCTYAQWIATAVPMLWTMQPHGRLFRVITASIFCQAVNFLRVFLSLLALANGASWFWAHDVPDYLIWYGSIAAIAWRWFKINLPVHRHE